MKTYVKPELFYERYELSKHIADCAWEMTYANENSCEAKADSVKIPGMADTLFTTTASCTMDTTLNPGLMQIYCYQPGVDEVKVFIS